MEIISQIELACKDNNHELNKSLLDSVESEELKKQAFLKIFDYYEKEPQIPGQYYVHFIEWLLKNGDIDTAKGYILKCNNLKIVHEEISELIYEYIIKPNEYQYRQRCDKNLELLKRYDLLFSKLIFDFENIKRKVFSCANYQTSFKDDVIKEEESAYCLVDVINLEIIRKLLEAGHTVYLVYDDPEKFNYLLLFEDLSLLEWHIKKKKIIFFPDGEIGMLQKFFSNLMVRFPRYFIDPSAGDYFEIVEVIKKIQDIKLALYRTKLKAYYKNKNRQYYENLFLKPISNIKILLITSLHTELNQHICRSWYNTFEELGYIARLLIEKEPFEVINKSFVLQQMVDFKPDIVFHINYSVDNIFEEEEIKNSLLWITRYRDKDGKRFTKAYNMFILPMHKQWAEELEKEGVPKDRTLYTPEGIDLSVFTKRGTINKQYTCDIVSVNNAGGDEKFRLNYWLGMYSQGPIQEIINELYDELKEISLNEYFVSYPVFEKMLDEKLDDRGLRITEEGRKMFLYCCVYITESFFRSKIMEWIVDSKITGNIKLWGKSWSNNEKLKHFHVGTAEHGKELSEIYGSSKISISDSVGSLHERNFEILASGGFPLIWNKRVEENKGIDTITNYFNENEEVSLFYNKDDLLNKVQYYLDNPEERERISENGRNVVIENFSNLAIAKRTMGFIKNYYLVP